MKAAVLATIPALGLAAPAAADVPRIARLMVGARTHRIGIEVGGQASQAFPKKPYGFETRRARRLAPDRQAVGGSAGHRPGLPRRTAPALAFAAVARLRPRAPARRRPPGPKPARAGEPELRPLAHPRQVAVAAQFPYRSHRSAVGGLKMWLARRAAWMDSALL